LTYYHFYGNILLMTHFEEHSFPADIQGSITEAEIALQQVELDNIDAARKRHQRILAAKALDPGAIEYIANLLTKEDPIQDKSSETQNK
jgi:hypothetical protein